MYTRKNVLDGRAIPAISTAEAVWLIGWLFAIGLAKLGFWSSLLAVFIWPYFVGSYLS